MMQQKQIGWASAAISILVLCLSVLWPQPQSWTEIRAFLWAYGVMWLLALLASVVAARTLSQRWYYLTAFWILIPVFGIGFFVFSS